MTFTRLGLNCLCRTSCPLSPKLEVVLHPVQPYSDGSHCWKLAVRVEPQTSVLPLGTPSYVEELLPRVKGCAGRPRVVEKVAEGKMAAGRAPPLPPCRVSHEAGLKGK